MPLLTQEQNDWKHVFPPFIAITCWWCYLVFFVWGIKGEIWGFVKFIGQFFFFFF